MVLKPERIAAYRYGCLAFAGDGCRAEAKEDDKHLIGNFYPSQKIIEGQ
jgi:hypothetical protein